MTRPTGSVVSPLRGVTGYGGSSLVLDGNTVKARLTAERQRTGAVVHVDWFRFTTTLRNAPAPDIEVLFPSHGGPRDAVAYERLQEVSRVLRSLPNCEHDAAAQARELAERVAQALGPDFAVASDIRKGHDFYRHRWAIERNGSECGWVGFLSSGESPRQRAQARTIHANVWGSACTFGSEGWNLRLADLCDEVKGVVTRVDLAADFFDGLSGGMDRVRADFESGAMDVGGKRPKPNMVGDWTTGGRGRSFYWGSKEAGKQTNAYQKGDQLFGVEAGSEWLRFELRYGNKLRVLSSDMLRRPADFFAGASDYHAALLRELEAQLVEAQAVSCKARLAAQSVLAECVRNLRWQFRTAGPSLAALFKFAPNEVLLSVFGTPKRPGRLKRFSDTELEQGFAAACAEFLTVGGDGPAFA